MPRLLTCALALLGALLLASPAHAISIAPETPRSPNADGIVATWWVMLAVAAVLVVAINVALLVAIVRFRAARGRRPARTTAARGALRPAVGGLAVLAIATLVFGVVMTADVRSVEPTGPGGLDPAEQETAQVGISDAPAAGGGEDPALSAPLVIDAVAQQWLWRFEYPGGQPGQRTFSYGDLVVPVDTTVILDVTSIDVAHTWWVPALGGQVQALPGSVSETWFKATEEGRYEGNSTTFSGTGFPSVRAWVNVVSVPDYIAHVEGLRRDLEEAQEAVAGTDDEAGATDAEAGAETGEEAAE